MIYSEQLHLDFPTTKEIDKLTIDQMKDMWVNAPAGYFVTSSTLSNYFEEKLDKAGAFTREFEELVISVYVSKLKDMIGLK